MATPDHDIPPGEPLPARQGYALAVLVLVASLVLVAIYATGAGHREEALAQARLVAEADQVTARLRQQLLTYELISRGGVSLIAAIDRPSRRQWRNYIDGLDLPGRFPAMLGLCYAQSLSPVQLQEFQLARREAEGTLFHIDPLGARPAYGPVVLMEPQTYGSPDIVGFDMLTEPVQAAAMEAAGTSAAARITAPLPEIRQGVGAGLVIYAPVYRNGLVPSSRQARASALVGWVCAPFRLDLFVARAGLPGRDDVSLRIVDIGDIEGEADDLEMFPLSPGSFPAPGIDGARHSRVEEVYGRQWRLDFHQAPQDGADAGLLGPAGTIYVGVLASLLLFALAMILARTQSRAQRIAARMSDSYRRSEMRFRSAIRFSAIGKALLDREGRIIDANLALADILRASPQELMGQSFNQLFSGGEEKAAEERARAASGTVYRVTRELHRDDGDIRQVHLTYAHVPGEHGHDLDRLVQVEDITDRLRAEAQVLALNRTLEARVALRTRELTRANEELESFAYTISHDLRAPLRAIDGFSRMVGERHGDAFDEVGRGYLARVRAATARMGELIDALLKMSRVSRGELRREPLDLSAMAEDIVAELAQGEPERSVQLDVEPGMAASGDSTLVRNMLANLLGNAWKFTRDSAPARIAMRQVEQDGERWFEVVDNGIGFDQAYAGKLFRPFQRLHAADEFPGEGVGLASVKRIVERHGGVITGKGVPGEGARFRFTLPDEPA